MPDPTPRRHAQAHDAVPPEATRVHGMLGLGTLLSGLAAIGGLGLASFQLAVKGPAQEQRTSAVEREVQESRQTVSKLDETYEAIDRVFGAREEDLRDLNQRIKDAGALVDELRRTEQALSDKIEGHARQIQSLTRQANAITGAIEDANHVPVLESAVTDDGRIILPDKTVAGLQLSDITLERSGSDVIISAMVLSPREETRVQFGESRLYMGVLEDGSEVFASQYNAARRGWDNYHAASANLRPGVPVIVQWRLAVPESYSHFRLLELWLRNESARDAARAKFENVAVP